MQIENKPKAHATYKEINDRNRNFYDSQVDRSRALTESTIYKIHRYHDHHGDDNKGKVAQSDKK